MFSWIVNVLRGIGVEPPVVVATARALAEVAVIAAIGAVSVELALLDWGQYAALSPGVFAGLRVAEGVADGIDPAKKRSGRE